MISKPRSSSGALYSFHLVVRYFGMAGAFILSDEPNDMSGGAGGDLCNKALS